MKTQSQKWNHLKYHHLNSYKWRSLVLREPQILSQTRTDTFLSHLRRTTHGYQRTRFRVPTPTLHFDADHDIAYTTVGRTSMHQADEALDLPRPIEEYDLLTIEGPEDDNKQHSTI